MCIIALLKFMDAFESSEQIQKNLEMQGEYFNSYLLDCLDEHFVRMKNKLPIEPIDDLGKDYFLNRRMSKVYYDVSKQPYLYISEGTVIYYVLSVGFNNAGIPFVTIQECNKVFCYRLPDDYSNWAMTVIGMANKGTNLFPSTVVFSKKNNKYYADIL